MIEGLTRPENAGELRDRRRILSILTRDGACTHCTQRVEGWGAAGCNHGLTFPLCTKGRRPQFELDEKTLPGRDFR